MSLQLLHTQKKGAIMETGRIEEQRHSSLGELRRWGYGTHSFLSLYRGFTHYRQDSVGGYIPYVETDKLILVAGEPVSAPEALPVLVRGLMRLALEKEKTLAILPASAQYKESFKKLGFDCVYIGKEPIFDLKALPKYPKSIRLAVNRAQRLGIRIEPYADRFAPQVEALCARWQDTRELPALQFLFQLRPLYLRENKKFFLAVDKDDKLLAFLSCSPIFGRNGWYLEDLIREPAAPNGTTEMLVTMALESLAQEGYDMATLALAPLAGMPDQDESHPKLNRILRLAYRRLSFLYHFQTLEYFKAKFKPSNWEPNYFYFYPAGVNITLARNLVEAFVGENLFSIVRHKIKGIFPRLKNSAARRLRARLYGKKESGGSSSVNNHTGEAGGRAATGEV